MMVVRLVMVAVLSAWMLSGCGGGGGGASGGSGGGGGGGTPAYANVQPAAAPAAEAFNPAIATGVVSAAADTLDPAGRVAGAAVELHPVLSDGSLGPAQASATTGADGSFSLSMPTGQTTGDGRWMLVAQLAGGPLRAYLHPGFVRIDASSEAWVRQVTLAAARVLSFASGATGTLRDIARAMALYADATGDRRAGLSASAAADWIVQSLVQDPAMNYVASTLTTSGALPGAGLGDIGSFFALTNSYAAFFTDQDGQRVRITTRNAFGVPKAADGAWSYNVEVTSQVNGQWTPIVGAGGVARTTASRGYQTLRASTPTESLITGLIGEYPAQSFPVRNGARQLDARRITATQLNFTGGTDEQPLAFSLIETGGGVESITVAAGSFRAARVVTDLEIAVPTSATGVSRVVLRTTLWLAPGAGILKELDQVFVDGVEDNSAAGSIELSQAYASNIVWPELVSISPDLVGAYVGTSVCRPVRIRGQSHFVTVESGPVVNGTPTLALARRDATTGQQIGELRVFQGFSAVNGMGCPIPIGSGTEFLVAEAFLSRNLQSDWPADFATATAQSDVVHIVNGVDLSELATFQLDAVPDSSDPSRFWPAETAFLHSAPDTSRQFLIGTIRTSYSGMLGQVAQFIQVLSPGLASARANLGRVLVIGADWPSGKLYTMENFGALTLSQVPFTAAGGANTASARVLRTGFFISQLWYASANLLHLTDGRTVRVTDGVDGPSLGYQWRNCGVKGGLLVCLDTVNDRLVKMNSDTLAVQTTAGLGSALRLLTLGQPDFNQPTATRAGVEITDESTFQLFGSEVHVGRWP